jgi:hypothetical protein
MPYTRKQKTKPSDLEAAQEDREELRHTTEQDEQQDLNQGMDTGTHDTTRQGVQWGHAYRTGNKKNNAGSGKRRSG